jgi:hypothetical protein
MMAVNVMMAIIITTTTTIKPITTQTKTKNITTINTTITATNGSTVQFSLAVSFNFLISCTVGRIPRTGDQPRVVLEPTISVLEQTKTFHVLDRMATVICKDNNKHT